MRETSHFLLKKARLLSDVRDFLRGSHSGDFSTHLIADCPHHFNGIEGLTSLQSIPPSGTFGVSAELLVQASANHRRVNVDARNHHQTIGELPHSVKSGEERSRGQAVIAGSLRLSRPAALDCGSTAPALSCRTTRKAAASLPHSKAATAAGRPCGPLGLELALGLFRAEAPDRDREE
jgi:hypothetical protein